MTSREDGRFFWHQLVIGMGMSSAICSTPDGICHTTPDMNRHTMQQTCISKLYYWHSLLEHAKSVSFCSCLWSLTGLVEKYVRRQTLTSLTPQNSHTQPLNHSFTHSTNRLTTKPLTQTINHPLSHLLTHSLNQSLNHSLTFSLNKSLNHWTTYSLTQPLNHLFAHSISPSTTH